MKKWISSLLALVVSAVCLKAATLQWDPSPTNTAAPAVVKYRVHSSPVGNPAFGNWTTFGETTSTNLLVTNNVYQMFRVVAVSAANVESDPSNVVTNDFAKPPSPGSKLIITGAIETAPTPSGPWETATNMPPLEVTVSSSNQFWRSRVTVASAR